MTNKTEVCGWQPTGNSEDIPKPPKFNTDKLSVEKIQEIRVEELKDFSSKILQAELKNQKLQEQLNTAKYFFKNILDVNPNLKKGSYAHLSNCVNVMKNSAEKALAAIGGDDE